MIGPRKRTQVSAELSVYLWEPAALIRSALEGFATGWDIVRDSGRFAAWKARRGFESTSSLANLREVVPNIGRLNGLLTDLGVHTKPFNSSPAMFSDGGGDTFQLFGYVPSGKEEERRIQVYITVFAAFICLNVAELVFHRYSPELETIELISGTNQFRFKVSARHRTFVHAMQVHFEGLAKAGHEKWGA